MKSAKEWVEIFIDHIGYSPEERIRAIQANCFRAAAEMAKLNHADSEKGIVDSLVDKLEEQAKKLEAKA